MSWEIVLPILGTALALTITGLFSLLVARNGRAEKREDRESAADLAVQELLDARFKDLLDRLGTRVDELEGETRELRSQAKEDRATIHALEVEVSTLRRENAGLRAQLARLTGLAAGAEADTAGTDD